MYASEENVISIFVIVAVKQKQLNTYLWTYFPDLNFKLQKHLFILILLIHFFHCYQVKSDLQRHISKWVSGDTFGTYFRDQVASLELWHWRYFGSTGLWKYTSCSFCGHETLLGDSSVQKINNCIRKCWVFDKKLNVKACGLWTYWKRRSQRLPRTIWARNTQPQKCENSALCATVNI